MSWKVIWNLLPMKLHDPSAEITSAGAVEPARLIASKTANMASYSSYAELEGSFLYFDIIVVLK